MGLQRLFELLWRLAVLAALVWIGWGLQQLHDDLRPVPDDGPTTAAAPAEGDPLQDDIDGLRDDVAVLAQKVDAILVVMARAK